MKKNIIIVDDHKMFLEGLKSIFDTEESYNVVLTVNSATNALKYLEINTAADIDLIITDISMPDMDGIALNNEIKQNFPSIKTLVVSMHEDAKVYETLKKQNADGYIPKNAEKKELLTAVDQILSGNSYFAKGVQQIHRDSIFTKEKDIINSLTEREKDILRLIAKEHTTQEIADTLFLSKHTIESYRKNLISKLNVRNLAGLTKYAIKLGLLD
ncbi:response regulator transcription factor [Aquimarina algicola]|uniref:Response regulator transcription factor n=1 Tax=Aquimarina algicola TaxID=2589995 RepID=A0A504JJF1_9FLAO|nr:response regulator transcription factor [Aquimarina algicola]TPN86879.1 response regulator transcription factor [Aquimarina algicola]